MVKVRIANQSFIYTLLSKSSHELLGIVREAHFLISKILRISKLLETFLHSLYSIYCKYTILELIHEEAGVTATIPKALNIIITISLTNSRCIIFSFSQNSLAIAFWLYIKYIKCNWFTQNKWAGQDKKNNKKTAKNL